jgi:hypothetical protein
MTNDNARKLRQAKAKLRAAKCSCTGTHDPFWVRCERTLAEIDVDHALAAFGVFP